MGIMLHLRRRILKKRFARPDMLVYGIPQKRAWPPKGAGALEG
jgi:hypothetical protein